MSFKNFSPVCRKLGFITLSPGTPHRRPLRPVEHAELESRMVSDKTHHSSEGIYLTDDLTFCNSAYRRIA